MRRTQRFNQIPQDYSIDEYLYQLTGKTLAADSLLRRACERVWDLPIEGSVPSSLDVAFLLSELGVDETTLIAALLSTSRLQQQDDAVQPMLSLEQQFGDKIMRLVKSVLQLHDFHGEKISSAPEQAERLRRMLLSMVDDVRAVLIKLAYRVQRLRQLKLASPEEQLEIAQESLEILAPVANRLGIGQLKWELEDLSFRYLEPDTYRSIASHLDEKRDEREQFITDVVAKIKTITNQEAITADIYGRPKHIFSIWKKMSSKQRSFDELFDVRAVRVVVETVAECYVVLGLVHAQWRHINKEFDDYIANPKKNGYQSLHTAVYGPQGKPVEIQIRTRKMHEFAENGVAAHWRYKESGSGASIQSSIDSLRKLLDSSITSDEELLENFNAEMFQDRVFVLTPEGRVIDLPEGATPVDFAYAVHTEIGHRCRGAKVNGRIVQLTCPLQNGQRVEILTAKEAAPRRDWMIAHLGFIKTSRARNRIRSWFRKQDREKNSQDGKNLFEREWKRHGIKPELDKIVQHFKQQSADDLYIALGCGDISVAQLSAILHELSAQKTPLDFPLHPPAHREKKQASGSSVNVSGVGNLLTSIAHCCMPVPNDEIIGYITKDRGVSVHRKDCKNILHLQEKDQSRLIEVEWGESERHNYPVTLFIQAIDRRGLLSDITSTLSMDKINVIAVNTQSNKKDQTAKMSVTIEIRDLLQLNRVMDKLSLLRNILQVSRASNGD